MKSLVPGLLKGPEGVELLAMEGRVTPNKADAAPGAGGGGKECSLPALYCSLKIM